MAKRCLKDLKYGGDMYIIVVYDICGEVDNINENAKVSRNVFKACKRYLNHVQKSVFEGELTKAQLMALENEISKYIRKDRDSVIVFTSRNERWLNKEFLGIEDDSHSSFF